MAKQSSFLRLGCLVRFQCFRPVMRERKSREEGRERKNGVGSGEKE
jgi:hypothetical protein